MDRQQTMNTVKYSLQDGIKFEKISLKLGRSKRLIFSQIIDYFYRSKKDPLDISDELLKNTILKGQREYIGFIRTQEAELLIPIKRDVTFMLDILKRIFNAFDSHILKHNEIVVGNQISHDKKLSHIGLYVKNLADSAETKQVMKRKFMTILNTYIKERERFTMMTAAKDKEQLADDARRQVEIL